MNATERKIDAATERMVTCYAIGHPLGVYSQRLERAQKKAAKEAYERLTGRETVSDDMPVYCNLAWEDKATARGMRLGVEEFKKNHPEYADELEQTIEYQRQVRRNFVEFGVRDGEQIPDEKFLQVMDDIGIPSNIAKSTLNTALRLAEYLKDSAIADRMLM